jgi:hypothetical protein
MKKKMTGSLAGFKKALFFILLGLQFFSLSAQELILDSITQQRLEEIQNLLRKDTKKALLWQNGWIAGYSAATVGQGIVCFSTGDKSLKQDMALGAATTFLGAMQLLMMPMVPPKTISSEESNTAYFEDMMKELSRKEKAGRSWKSHALCSAVNVGSGLITWLGFKRTFMDGVANFALNTVITEAQIWSQSTRAIKDYNNYCKKNLDGSASSAVKPETQWIVKVYPGGISLGINF